MPSTNGGGADNVRVDTPLDPQQFEDSWIMPE